MTCSQCDESDPMSYADGYAEGRVEADSLATQLEQMRRERDEARKSFRTVAHAVGICHCHDGGCEPGPIEEIVAEVVRLREREGDEMDARFALDEARTTNARLHRRAQGVEAGKPEDEETIRRLRAEVRATAKHAGHVTGYVYRLQMAANFAQHATSMAVRERDEARAKLARIRRALVRIGSVTPGGTMTAMDVVNEALRIIDEKEGGQ